LNFVVLYWLFYCVLNLFINFIQIEATAHNNTGKGKYFGLYPKYHQSNPQNNFQSPINKQQNINPFKGRDASLLKIKEGGHKKDKEGNPGSNNSKMEEP